ncbi:WalW protein [Erythrobacter insulae]|uniref:WalW protein n=1 Tax=Erythrobacter insulae TaxID=2584124 RepID=A0A547P8L6_9SPHN|nr:polysaccharide deacetylase family protein [Erythrobacter insulae]TRD10495.1 WalW protein [Erythrobacter insulae]
MAKRSMLAPPPGNAPANFASDFGQRVLLTVDTEEEFDWAAPFSRDDHGLQHTGQLARFQSVCEELGAHPVYLVDWPIAHDGRAVEIIGDALRRKTASIGMQLHGWVNPPFDEAVNTHNSFAGNLPPELEAAKFTALRDRIEHAFGTAPAIYRAGRYGVGPNTADLLKDNGFALDTSVRSLFDYSEQGGPDFTHHPAVPYWIDDESTVLELPVTSVYWGMLRQLGRQIHRAQRHMPTFFAAFSKLSLLERIALTPEGVTVEEALRGIDIALDDGLPLLILSFHSPSLAPGHTPYSRSDADVERIYDWFRQIYAYLDRRGVRSTTPNEIISSVKR